MYILLGRKYTVLQNYALCRSITIPVNAQYLNVHFMNIVTVTFMQPPAVVAWNYNYVGNSKKHEKALKIIIVYGLVSDTGIKSHGFKILSIFKEAMFYLLCSAKATFKIKGYCIKVLEAGDAKQVSGSLMRIPLLVLCSPSEPFAVHNQLRPRKPPQNNYSCSTSDQPLTEHYNRTLYKRT